MKRNVLIFVFLILAATSFKYRSKTQAGILNADTRVIIEQNTDSSIDPGYNKSTETDQIRSLENQERVAMIKRDTAALFQLWSPELTVNNPGNRVLTFTDLKNDLSKNITLNTSFDRVIDKITITGDLAVVMGSEITSVSKASNKPEKSLSRRYTNIWMKTGNDWKLTARQATNIISE